MKPVACRKACGAFLSLTLAPSAHETSLQVEVIDNAGHFVFLEQPQLFNAALLRITAPYLKRGLAERLISEETEAARRLAKEQQEHQGGSGDGEAPAAPAPFR